MWTRQASQLSAAGHLVADEQKMIQLESPEAKTRKSFPKITIGRVFTSAIRRKKQAQVS